MNQVNFRWIGPTGFNPIRGYVEHGQPVRVEDDDIKQELIRCRLIEPITKTTQSGVKKDGGTEEKSGQTSEE